MYVPAKQTILEKEVNIFIDEETKNFIPKMTNLILKSNIPTYNTKKCIVNKSKNSNVKIYNYHDTHLTVNGTKALYDCLIKSDLKILFK